MPLVTVLLPVYNGEKYLADAVKSVLLQTFSDFELLVIDDGSTDGSSAILESFSDQKIRVIRNEKRLKLSGALNRGIDNAGGTYIARMDADDICRPDRLAWQVRFMDLHPEVGICGGWVEAFGNHPSSGTIFKYPSGMDDIKASLLFDNPFAHPTVIFRKQLFDRFNLRFDGSYNPAEDYELWARALECFPSANIGKVLLRYRLHANSMTLSGRSAMDAHAVRILKPLFSRMGLSPSDEDLVFHRYISTNRITPDWMKESVEHAELWLLRLVEANKISGRYDQEAFAKAVAKVWFSVAYHSLGLGWRTVRKYLMSNLNSRSASVMKNQIVLFLAALKRIFMSNHDLRCLF
jgi:glycosyltransferase involved in cell wall biosynthesis